MKLSKEELGLLHLACYKLNNDWEELPKLTVYAKDQLNKLIEKLLVEIKK